MKRRARRARLMAWARFGIAGTIALLCMASTVRAQTIIDNGDPGFTHSGLGTVFSPPDLRGYGDTGLGTPVTSAGDMAQWAFSGLTPNTWYDVLYHPFEWSEQQATFSGPVFEITVGTEPTFTVDTLPAGKPCGTPIRTAARGQATGPSRRWLP